MRKLFTLFFALMCATSIFAYDCKIEGIYYNLNQTTMTAEVTNTIGHDKAHSYSGSITLPSTIIYKRQTYVVTTIGDNAFSGCSSLTSVTIPNSVTTIGESAFYDCTSLTSITIPNSVTTIGESAFSFCESLTSVTIPNSVTTIGEHAFSYCRGLTSVTIPNSVTTIGEWAFEGCSGLKRTNYTGTIADWCKIKFEFYANPIYYSHNLYINDVEVKNLVIPEGVDTIGNWAFDGCRGLTSVTIPNSVTTIGEWAFEGCSGLTAIEIPNSVQYIGAYAFDRCNLTSIIIPQSVKEIKQGCFDGCVSLKNVIILSKDIKEVGHFNYPIFKDCQIDHLYCGTDVDLTYAGGIIKNVHHLDVKDMILLCPFPTYAQHYVESRINQWQKKGEYEKTADWQKRVNESSRKKKVDEFLKEAKQNYLAAYKKRQTYQFSLGSYDPDNEVYLVKEATLGDLLVPVSISDAQYVRNNWSSMKVTPQYAFSGNEVILKSVGFVFPNNKSYAYKPSQNLTYAQADIQYNFDPIDLNLGSNISSSQPKGQQTIQQKQITIGKSEVDTNIPVTNTKNANTFVVIIANENYQSVAKVPFANNDGEILSQYCNKTLGIPTENIHIYKDATYNNMRSALAWLETVCRSYDGIASVIFYYTGHGIPDESNKTAYLLPVDGDGKYVQSGIALDEVYSKLGAMPSKSITILLDACFSGATRDGAMLASAKGVAIKVKKGTPVGNTVALTAAQSDETAGFYEEQGHGLFTYFLLKKLQETKGDVTLEQLSNYISTEVKRRSAVQGKIQTPSITPSSSLANNWQNWKLK